jgi:hypothetical protein
MYERRQGRVMHFLSVRLRRAGGALLAAITVTGVAWMGGQAVAAEPFGVAAVPYLATGPQAQAYVGARYGGLWGLGSHLVDEKTAAATVPLNWLALQIEGRGAGLFLSGTTSARAMGAGHFYLPTSFGAAGVFGGFEVSTIGGVAFVGAEARAHLGGLVPYAQVGGGPGIDGAPSATWIRVGAQAFLTQNFLLQGDVRYLDANLSSWLFSGNLEFRLDGRPWSGHATLNHQTGVGSGGGATSFLAGIRVHLGNGSLYQAYTTGPGWSVLPMMF